MDIRNDSKKIIQFFLLKVIERGDLIEPIVFQYGDLAKELELESEKYCRVCCQYLCERGYIGLHSCRDRSNPQSKDMQMILGAAAIDFLED